MKIKQSLKLKELVLIFIILASTTILIACDSSDKIRSGAYVIDKVQTIESIDLFGIENTIITDLDESREHSWLVLDMETRKVYNYSPRNEEPAMGELSANLRELHTDRDETLPFEPLRRNRFALTMPLFGEYRIVYRWVDDDSKELAMIRAEREAIMQQRAEKIRSQKAQLSDLVNEAVELDLRRNLPADEVSIALPADTRSLSRSDKFGYTLSWASIATDKVNILPLPTISRGEYFSKLFEESHQWFLTSIPAHVELDDDTIIGLDSNGKYRLLARTEQNGYSIIMRAEVDERHFSTLMSIWRSLDEPVEKIELLRRPEVTLPRTLIGQDVLSQYIVDTLEQEIRPDNFLQHRRLQPKTYVSFPPPSISLLENQAEDKRSSLNIHAELIGESPRKVIEEFTTHSISEHSGIEFGPSGRCRAYVAIQVDVADRPYTLLLRQAGDSDYASCLVTLATLEKYDLTQPLYAEIPSAFLEHFAVYPRYHTRLTERGDVQVRLDGLYGIISSSGQVLAHTEYDDIELELRFSDAGYRVTSDGKRGFLSTNGELLLPPIYDQLHTIADHRAMIIVLKDNLQGMYNLQTRDFTLPLSKELTSINYSQDGLVITQDRNESFGLFSIQGGTLIEDAAYIGKMRNLPLFKVQMEKQDTRRFRFHGLDGIPLSNEEYSYARTHFASQRINVRDTDDNSFYIDFDLNRLTPEGLVAVYPPTEGGYTVVSDKSTQPNLHGMTNSDDELVLPLEFLHVFPLREGLISAQAQNSLWGIWSKIGEPVLAPEWQAMGQSFKGKIYARKDDFWQLINQQGDTLDNRRWSTLLFNFRNSFNYPPFTAARVESGQHRADRQRWEILNMQGERLLDETFDDATPFDFGIILTRGDEQLKYPDDFR